MSAPRYLMCRPDYFNAHFLFNPWLSYADEVDQEKAQQQWRALRHAIVAAGGEVIEIEPSPFEAAMVYTRDNAVVYADGRAMLLRSVGPRGLTEPKLLKRWFKTHGYTVTKLPRRMHLEGGNMVFRDARTMLAGYKSGEDVAAYEWFAAAYQEATGYELSITFVRLMNRKYLHLDTAVSFLGDSAVLVYPPALNLGDNWQHASLWGGRTVVALSDEEYFAANAVCVNDTVIAAGITASTQARLEALGFRVRTLDLSEFIKGGGSAHCLTLDLVPPVSA